MSTFLPFSQRSRPWEVHAEGLRRLLPNTFNDMQFDPIPLAPMVGLHVVQCAFKGLSEDELTYMRDIGANQWSGGVFTQLLPNGQKLCMLNPAHSPRRNKITLLEEICHCHFDHQPTKLTASGDQRVRDFQKAIEEEAYGVGAAVLLPWRFFFPRLNNGATVYELSEDFGVTQELVSYRIKITGATPLHRARQRTRSQAISVNMRKENQPSASV